MMGSFDSGLAASALALFAAAAMAWRLCARSRVAARINIRFGAVLFAALAAAAFVASFAPSAPGIVFTVGVLVASLGSAALALGVFGLLARPIPPFIAATGLTAALALGLGACLSGMVVLATIAQILAVAAMAALGFSRLAATCLKAVETLAGAVALLFAGMALLQGAAPAMLLFSAAGLFGLACASQTRIELPYARNAGRLIGDLRV